MILKPISEGRGVASLVAYLAHDQVSADDPRPTTDERVAWTATLGGSPTGDVDLCVRMMQGRVADALRRCSSSGRACPPAGASCATRMRTSPPRGRPVRPRPATSSSSSPTAP